MSVASPTTNVGSIVTSQRVPNSNLVRVGYTVEFYNSDTEEYQTYGGYVDVLGSRDLNFIYDLILKKTVTFMQNFYGYGKISNKDLKEILASIQFKTLEIV